MTLSPGTRLGPYEIVAPIGAGGMGEVFRARDTRLDRSVAIKILPAALAHDPQFRARFEREAKTISQLNHPHICQIYDVGEALPGDSASGRPPLPQDDGSDAGGRGARPSSALSYLVMEMLEGESLADRLSRGALPLPEVLRHGAQIADALAAAHRAGIVHRDLKPGNIMITKSGAKLLDFGLAKGADGAAPIQIDGTGATEHRPLTAQGTILGTFQYMAPEQLEGQEADARTDIFTLGTVLYEMATGKRAFEGKTKTSLIAAIIRDQPRPISQLQPLTPLVFEHVIAKCLEKDPDARWQSAHDIAEELKWISEAGSQAGVPAPVLAKKRSRERLAWAIAALAALAATAAIVLSKNAGRPSERLRFSIPTPQETTVLVGTASTAISPDGHTVAFAGRSGAGVGTLFVRSLAEFEPRAISGTDGATNPFFSPDGRWIGFSAEGKLRKVLATGGSVSEITSVPTGGITGADWGEDDRIVYAPSYNTGIYIVSASGTTPKQITTNDPKKRESSHGWPQFLPGGKWIIFTVENSGRSFNDATIVAHSLESGERRVLVRGGTRGQYVPTGHLVFARSNSLFAVPFDPRRVQVGGPPVEVMKGVAITQWRGASHWSFSRTGTLLFVPGPEVTPDEMMGFCDRAGIFTPLSEKLNGYNAVSLSPDERTIAFQRRWSDDDVWIHDIERDVQTRVTFVAEQANPIWSSDGRRLIFGSDRDGTMNLYTATPDGTGVVERLTTSRNTQEPTSISPSGVVAYQEADPETKSDVWLLPLSTDRKPEPLIRTPYDDYGAQFSPDGKWLLWISTESGRPEVYVRSMVEGGKWQVSTAGGNEARWSRDGKEIYYRNGTQMLAVAVSTSPALRISRPTVLFDAPYRRATDWELSYGVTRDGRFLMVKLGPGINIRELRVVLDWFGELKEKL